VVAVDVSTDSVEHMESIVLPLYQFERLASAKVISGWGVVCRTENLDLQFVVGGYDESATVIETTSMPSLPTRNINTECKIVPSLRITHVCEDLF
jgi:hypothetical protein